MLSACGFVCFSFIFCDRLVESFLLHPANLHMCYAPQSLIKKQVMSTGLQVLCQKKGMFICIGTFFHPITVENLTGNEINLLTVPDVQWDRRHTVWLSIWWIEETNWHANGGNARGVGGTGYAFFCHTSKCIQLAYLSFQFPFEVNTEQSRWRYDWLNWTRLSKYYMTSHKLLGVVQT